MLGPMAAPDEGSKGKVGLILAGGGARGAYEIGALSELLPRLDERDRPDVIVGTSVGAINAAWLAANADRDPAELLAEGRQIWRDISWERAVSPLGSLRARKLGAAFAADLLGVPGVRSWSLLDPSPLEKTLGEAIPDFGRIHENVKNGKVTTAAVVATRASTSLSVVFCDSAEPLPPNDSGRGINYQPATLEADHVLASAAIPGVFPARKIRHPQAAWGWYSDGGTRLNTPIKPAIRLGADRLIIVALHSPTFEDRASGGRRPDIIDGAGLLVQATLADPLVNDMHTMVTINELIAQSPKPPLGRHGPYKQVEYILIAPRTPNAIGKLAAERYANHYAGLRNFRRRRHSISKLGRLLDMGGRRDAARGEILSYLMFDREFANDLIELGREDARRWFTETPDKGMPLWRTSPTPGPGKPPWFKRLGGAAERERRRRR
jgi:NTE family protein